MFGGENNFDAPLHAIQNNRTKERITTAVEEKKMMYFKFIFQLGDLFAQEMHFNCSVTFSLPDSQQRLMKKTLTRSDVLRWPR